MAIKILLFVKFSVSSINCTHPLFVFIPAIHDFYIVDYIMHLTQSWALEVFFNFFNNKK